MSIQLPCLALTKKTPIENAKLIWDTDKKDPGLKLKPDSEATDKNGQQTATLTSTTPLSDIQVSVRINGERVTTDKKSQFYGVQQQLSSHWRDGGCG